MYLFLDVVRSFCMYCLISLGSSAVRSLLLSLGGCELSSFGLRFVRSRVRYVFRYSFIDVCRYFFLSYFLYFVVFIYLCIRLFIICFVSYFLPPCFLSCFLYLCSCFVLSLFRLPVRIVFSYFVMLVMPFVRW